MADNRSSPSGLTEDEAKEFHSGFITMFALFTAIAAVAHFLVWSWRPWLPGPNGYKTADLPEAIMNGVAHISTLLT
jgi:light-harvesting complex 1 beta chain